jgi:hypothetical protein
MHVATPTQRHYTGDHGSVGRFEAFFVSAVVTVVLVRAFLIVTGYPKVGGGGLHIAHVLWGGLLMAAAIVTALVHPGSRSKHRAAVLGGIGFGLFIDEVGKFLTKDVNYFFRPAIAIIYLVFVALYLIVRETALRRPLTDGQRLAIASTALTDLSLGQLGDAGRRYSLRLLDEVSTQPELSAAIRTGLNADPQAPAVERGLTRWREGLVSAVRGWLGHERVHVGLFVLLVLQVLVIFGQLALLLVHPQAGSSHGSDVTSRAAQVSAGLSGVYTLFGAARLVRGDRAGALRVLFRSVLVTMVVTQMFVFAEYQASGVVGLAVDLALFWLLRAAGEAAPEAFRAQPGTPVPSQRVAGVSSSGRAG